MTAPAHSNAPSLPSSRGGLVGFTLLAVALALGGVGFYRQKREEVRQEQYQVLAAIGELKAGQLQSWRRERLEDAWRMARGPMMKRLTLAFLARPDAAPIRTELMELLQLNKSASPYHSASLLALDGQVLLSTEDAREAVNPATERAIAAASAHPEAVLSDFFQHADGIMHLDAIAAVRTSEGQPLAVVVLRSNTKNFLFPLIQDWPLPSRSAETVLAVRVGDEVAVPHPLRHEAVSTPRWHERLTHFEIPSVQAVLGRQGRFEGKDYRGVQVLADLRSVPDSPWFLVSKMDSNESVAGLHHDALFIAIITASFILLAGAAFAYVHRQRQAQVFKEQYEAEQRKLAIERSLRTSEERLNLALAATHQGLYDYDIETGEGAVSEEYATMLGYDPAEFHETHEGWLARMHPDDRVMAETVYDEYLAGLRDEYRVEFRQRTRDGAWKWILSLGKIVDRTPEGKPLRMLGTRTDITELKEGEARLRASEYLLTQTQALAGLGSYRLDLATGIWASSAVLDGIFGIDEGYEHSIETWTTVVHPEWREARSRYIV